MSIFPMPQQPKRVQLSACPTPQPSMGERLRESERRCVAAERELERVTRQSDEEANAAASAIARLSAALDRERARANEFERIMGAMVHEFGVLNATATTLAERAGVAPEELAELKRTCAENSADPDHAAVGLHQSASDFLVKAARTACRKAYHPDTRPQSEKATAEEMFKRNETAFERLFKTRGLSS